MATINNKEFYLKVYRPGKINNNNYIDTIYDFNWTKFRKQINAGLGDFSFTLAKSFDDFGQGNLIAHNNQVRFYAVDKESGPLGSLMYSGWIYAFESIISGNTEQVTVYCYGNATKLSATLLKSGTTISMLTNSGTLSAGAGQPQAVNVETVFQKVLDRYQAEVISPMVNYTSTSVGTTGATLSYLFDKVTYADALDICLKFAPAGWYWYSDVNDVVNLQNKPATATHTFVFGKDFEEVDIFYNADQVANNVLLETTNTDFKILKRYRDTTSEGLYDDRWTVVTDTKVADQTSANNLGNANLNSLKNAIRRTRVTIIDSNQSVDLNKPVGYNIELINPGDTCKFKGFNTITSQNFSDNMLIVSVDYSDDSAVIEVEQLTDSDARQTLAAFSAAQDALASNAITDYS